MDDYNWNKIFEVLEVAGFGEKEISIDNSYHNRQFVVYYRGKRVTVPYTEVIIHGVGFNEILIGRAIAGRLIEIERSMTAGSKYIDTMKRLRNRRRK